LPKGVVLGKDVRSPFRRAVGFRPDFSVRLQTSGELTALRIASGAMLHLGKYPLVIFSKVIIYTARREVIFAPCMQGLNGNGWEVMGKSCSVGLFCFALFTAFDSAFSAQGEAVAEKDKLVMRKSSASRRERPYPWKTRIVTTVFWIGEQPG